MTPTAPPWPVAAADRPPSASTGTGWRHSRRSVSNRAARFAQTYTIPEAPARRITPSGFPGVSGLRCILSSCGYGSSVSWPCPKTTPPPHMHARETLFVQQSHFTRFEQALFVL
jgi:hypothetical protein